MTIIKVVESLVVYVIFIITVIYYVILIYDPKIVKKNYRDYRNWSH